MDFFYDYIGWNLLWFILIGAFAGWIAGRIMQGRGYGVFGNMIIGIFGAGIGGILSSFLGWGSGGFLGSVVSAVIGAIILMALVGFIAKRKK